MDMSLGDEIARRIFGLMDIPLTEVRIEYLHQRYTPYVSSLPGLGTMQTTIISFVCHENMDRIFSFRDNQDCHTNGYDVGVEIIERLNDGCMARIIFSESVNQYHFVSMAPDPDSETYHDEMPGMTLAEFD